MKKILSTSLNLRTRVELIPSAMSNLGIAHLCATVKENLIFSGDKSMESLQHIPGNGRKKREKREQDSDWERKIATEEEDTHERKKERKKNEKERKKNSEGRKGESEIPKGQKESKKSRDQKQYRGEKESKTNRE